MRKTPTLFLYVGLLITAALATAALVLSLTTVGAQPTAYKAIAAPPYHARSLTFVEEKRIHDLHTYKVAKAARARRLLLAHQAARRRAEALVATPPPLPVYVAPVTTTTYPYVAPTTTTTPYVAPTYSGDGYIDPYGQPYPFSCIISHESNGYDVTNYSSGASGYYQFLDSTWTSVSGLPAPASAYSFAEQTAVANELYAQSGISPWSGDGC